MLPSSQTKNPSVLNPAPSSVHPTELSLARFALNEMGVKTRKKLATHLESCPECRKTVARHHELARRYRDLERRAISSAVNP